MEELPGALATFLSDLKAAREYQQVTLERIARETHISHDFLLALEEGRWERLPAPFLRGYLTAYAECVGMVRDKVLKRFDELDWRPPSASLREPGAPPFPARTGDAPAERPAAPAPPRVPSFLTVLPARVKLAALLAALLLLAAALWGLAALTLSLWPDAPESEGAQDRVLEEAPPVTLRGGAPFQVRLLVTRPGELRVLCQDTVCFSGTATPAETLALSSATSVLVQAASLEDLRLWRDGRALDLPPETGPADLLLTSREVKVMPRRSP
jgi:hypothetical protein